MSQVGLAFNWKKMLFYSIPHPMMTQSPIFTIEPFNKPIECMVLRRPRYTSLLAIRLVVLMISEVATL